MNHIRSLYPDGYYAMVISHITDNWQQNDRQLSTREKKGNKGIAVIIDNIFR